MFTEKEIKEMAILATQYCNTCCTQIKNNETITAVIDEIIKPNLDYTVITKYNYYLLEVLMSETYYYNDLDEMCELYFTLPSEALRACFYGDFNYTDDLFYIDGYGNISSCTEWHLVQDILKDEKFLRWYCYRVLAESKDDFITDYSIPEITHEANILLANEF